jgi:hypothetical protein
MKWSQILRRIELCMREMILRFQMNPIYIFFLEGSTYQSIISMIQKCSSSSNCTLNTVKALSSTLSLTLNSFTECPDGYFGPSCEQLCPYPTFGKDCQMECNCSKKVCSPRLGCKGSIFFFNLPLANVHFFSQNICFQFKYYVVCTLSK